MRILFAAAPGYGMLLPVVPLAWAARACGHEILVATTAYVTKPAAESGLPVADVFPARDVGADLISAVAGTAPDLDDPDAERGLPPGYWPLALAMKPFDLFTLATAEGTTDVGREFDAELVIYTSDHPAGALAAAALGRPALEVGNRLSWSMRDQDFRSATDHKARIGVVDEESAVIAGLRERLGIGSRQPDMIARIDPRAPSMGGLRQDERDPRDGVPWWPMRYVPYNGGAVLPAWAMRRPERPRICLTLGTVTPLLSDGSLLAMLIEALGGLPAEVILADHSTDLSHLGTLPDNVRPAGFVPLSGFLPTCALIVHHGGSGTSAAALHYGVPQLILADGSDNPLIARRVTDRKAGLALDPAKANIAAVRSLVERLLDEPAFAEAAAMVGVEMAEQPSPVQILERAVARAVVRRR